MTPAETEAAAAAAGAMVTPGTPEREDEASIVEEVVNQNISSIIHAGSNTTYSMLGGAYIYTPCEEVVFQPP